MLWLGIFSLVRRMGKRSGNFYMNEQRTGVVASLAIHACFLSLLLILPTANLTSIKTFHISFEQQKPFSTDRASIAQAATPKQAHAQNANRQEVLPAQPQRQSDLNTHMTDKKSADIIISPKVALQGSTATVTTSSKIVDKPLNRGGSGSIKMGNVSVVETKFGDIDAPVFIHREMPVYPRLARRMEREGKVVLKILIDHTGTVQKIAVIQHAAYGFTEAAVEAVRKSSFAPARRNGEKVVSNALLAIRFRLE